jgi:hypothetical protein
MAFHVRQGTDWDHPETEGENHVTSKKLRETGTILRAILVPGTYQQIFRH